MSTRPLSLLHVLAIILLVSACGRPDTALDLEERASAIHSAVITIDTHDDIPPNYATAEADPGIRGDMQVDLPKMREGGLDAGFFVVYVGQTERTPENYETAKADAMVKFDAIHRMTDEMYPDQIELAYAADDVERIHASGKLVAMIGIENGYAIGKDLSLLDKYHALGARYITLAHGGHNDIADSATPREDLGDEEAEHNGLSDFGAEVVDKMNRLGIMVDVSHISKKAMLDAVRLSKAPVIGSHSGVRSMRDHPRNMDDEQLQALKGNGGVIQTVALRDFVKADPEEKQEAFRKLGEEFGVASYADFQKLSEEEQGAFMQRRAEVNKQWPGATVQDYVDHIDYAVDLIGIDYVGISSDFDGGGGVEGWDDASETLNITVELVRRGYTEDQIRKLWGGNLLRVLREAERVAQEMQLGEA